MRCLRSLFCILVVVSVVPSASAQQITASIRGNISDPSGAVVQEASVTAKQAETGLIRTLTSARPMISAISPEGGYVVYMAVTVFRSRVCSGGGRRLSLSCPAAHDCVDTRLRLCSSASKVSQIVFIYNLTILSGRGVRWRSTC